jgi:uncharacterized protein (TIGR02996 family)
MAEMHRFHDATRTPGRPIVDPQTIFPLRRSREEQALLQAVVADLPAIAPRLAYADWLARSDAPRAEFIRVQCALAAGADPAEAPSLREREQQLLDEHVKTWLLPLAAIGVWPTWGTDFIPSLFFARGFVDRVIVLRREVLAEHAARLWEAAPALTKLAIFSEVDVPQLVAQPAMRQITELTFVCQHRRIITQENMLALTRSPHLGAVRELTLADPLADISIAVLCASPLLGQLHSLNLGKCSLSAKAVTMLASSPRSQQLTSLAIGGCQFDVVAGQRMAESPYLRQLQSLSFCFNDHFYRADLDADALRAMLATDWPQLTSLDLSQCRIGDAGARAIAESPGVAHVQELLLNNTEITDEGALAIANSPYLNALTNLSIPHSEEIRPALIARIHRNAGVAV